MAWSVQRSAACSLTGTLVQANNLPHHDLLPCIIHNIQRLHPASLNTPAVTLPPRQPRVIYSRSTNTAAEASPPPCTQPTSRTWLRIRKSRQDANQVRCGGTRMNRRKRVDQKKAAKLTRITECAPSPARRLSSTLKQTTRYVHSYLRMSHLYNRICTGCTRDNTTYGY
jgi:hypothetical protein